MAKRAFGELESEILHIMRTGQSKTVKQVHIALGGEDNYNTIMTVMSRLVEKKQLARKKIGIQYEYWMDKTSAQPSFLYKLKQKLLGVSPKVLVSHLIDSADELTEEDIQAMEQLLIKAKGSKT